MTDANRRAPHHDWRPAAKIKRDTPIKPQRSHKSHQSHRSRYHLTRYELQTVFVGQLDYAEGTSPEALRHSRTIILHTEMFRNALRFSDEQPHKPIAAAIQNIARTLEPYQDERRGIWVYPSDANEQRNYLKQEAKARRERQEKAQEAINRALSRRTTVKPPADAVGGGGGGRRQRDDVRVHYRARNE